MPCPIRFGPLPRMTTAGDRWTRPRSRPRRSSSGTASRRRTRRRTCRRSCTSGARRRPRAAARTIELVAAPQVRELRVAEAELLGPPPLRDGSARQAVSSASAARSSMISRIWSRNHGSILHASCTASIGDAAAQQLADLEDALGRRDRDQRPAASSSAIVGELAPRLGRSRGRGGRAPASAVPSAGSRGTSARWPSPRRRTASACRGCPTCRAASRTPTAGSW